MSVESDVAECRRMLGVLLGWQLPQGPEVAALAALRADISQAALNAAVKANAEELAAGIQVVIRDTDMERIRDAAVEANERTTGEIRDNGVIRFRPRLPGEA